MDTALKIRKATYHLWTFTISKLISTFGASVYAFGISFYILSITGSATSFATNLICSIVPRVLLAPFAGYAADKYSKKKIVIIAQICSVIAVGGLLAVSLTMGLSLVAIYITTCVLSITSLFSSVTFSASIANLIDEERIQKAMSFNQMSVSIATIGGPAVGGLLFGLVSMPLFLVIHMLGYVVAVVLEATMDFKLFTKKTDEVLEEVKETMIQSIKAGFHYLKQHRVLTVIIWVALAINFLFGAFEIGYSYILVEELNVESIHFGFTEGALSVGVLGASIFLSTRKDMKFPLVTSKRGIIIMGILMASIGLPLVVTLSYFGIVSFYMVVMFSFGVTMVFVNTPIGVMMQKRIDEEYRGRVFGILETMAMALTPLGMVIFGLLYDIVPAQWVLFGSSTILLLTVLYMLRPSIMKEAHPELGEQAIVKETVEVAS
jgi:DHA3 family macrolide efflux protein-like MFS transporter